ncbi:MAG: monovalent cation/H+ antiporter subunit D family protein [Xanthomonadales bacterium]|nr:monovalent cation/H+ antiporter subunit D family protein [Xanthomonadales bacterium]
MIALQPHLPVLVVIAPLLAAPLVSLLSGHRLAWSAATAASLCAFLVAVEIALQVQQTGPLVYELGSWAAPYGIALMVDAFSALLLVIVCGASTAGLLVAARGLGDTIARQRLPLFYTAWLLALAGMVGIVVSADAFNIFVFMEISSLATYILVAGGQRRQALTATFKYLIMGTLGATFYLIGIGLIYMMTGTLNLADMEVRIREVGELRPILVAGGFITVGLALKAAVFPLHTWLPNAYAEAPHPVSAFLAACSTKVALYVLLRLDFFVFQGNVPGHVAQFTAFILPLAVVAILAASVLAARARELKHLLAYSSIAQVGTILLGASMVSVTGLTAGVAHMFNHALAKGALFVAVTCLAACHPQLSLDKLAGAARRMPLTMAGFVVAGLSLIGLPGTAGFISKWYLVLAAIELGPAGIWLIAPVLAASLIAVVYIWRVIEPAYFGQADPELPRREAHWSLLLVLWGVVLLNLYFGLQPEFTLSFSRQAAEALLAVTN